MHINLYFAFFSTWNISWKILTKVDTDLSLSFFIFIIIFFTHTHTDMHTDFYINGSVQLKLFLQVDFLLSLLPFSFLSFSTFSFFSLNPVSPCTSWCIPFSTFLHSHVNLMHRWTCAHTPTGRYFILYLKCKVFLGCGWKSDPFYSHVFTDQKGGMVLALAHCSYFSM